MEKYHLGWNLLSVCWQEGHPAKENLLQEIPSDPCKHGRVISEVMVKCGGDGGGGCGLGTVMIVMTMMITSMMTTRNNKASIVY